MIPERTTSIGSRTLLALTIVGMKMPVLGTSNAMDFHAYQSARLDV